MGSLLQRKDSYLGKLQIVHIAIGFGQISILIIAIGINFIVWEVPIIYNLSVTTQSSIPVICLSLVLYAFYYFNRKLSKIYKEIGVYKLDGLIAYRSLSIIRWALLEIAVMLSIVAYLLSGLHWLIAWALLMIAIFARIHPTKDKVASDLGLSRADARLLDQMT